MVSGLLFQIILKFKNLIFRENLVPHEETNSKVTFNQQPRMKAILDNDKIEMEKVKLKEQMDKKNLKLNEQLETDNFNLKKTNKAEEGRGIKVDELNNIKENGNGKVENGDKTQQKESKKPITHQTNESLNKNDKAETVQLETEVQEVRDYFYFLIFQIVIVI